MSETPVMFIYHIPKTAGQSLRLALAAALGLNKGFWHLGPYGDSKIRKGGLSYLEDTNDQERQKISVVAGHYLDTNIERLFGSRKKLRVTFLREPAERIISQYNHAMHVRVNLLQKPVQDFYDWYECQLEPTFPWKYLYKKDLTNQDKAMALGSAGHNYIAKFILNALGNNHSKKPLSPEELYSKAAEIFTTFEYVGCVEKYNQGLMKIGGLLGVRLAICRHNQMGSASRAVYLNKNPEILSYLKENNRVDYALYNHFCA